MLLFLASTLGLGAPRSISCLDRSLWLTHLPVGDYLTGKRFTLEEKDCHCSDCRRLLVRLRFLWLTLHRLLRLSVPNGGKCGAPTFVNGISPNKNPAAMVPHSWNPPNSDPSFLLWSTLLILGEDVPTLRFSNVSTCGPCVSGVSFQDFTRVEESLQHSIEVG